MRSRWVVLLLVVLLGALVAVLARNELGEGSGRPVAHGDAEGTELARFVGGAPEGQYSLPAPSGPRTLRVGAAGYETSEEAVHLPTEPPEAEFVSYLAPR